jgi:hypothetical protein
VPLILFIAAVLVLLAVPGAESNRAAARRTEPVGKSSPTDLVQIVAGVLAGPIGIGARISRICVTMDRAWPQTRAS